MHAKPWRPVVALALALGWFACAQAADAGFRGRLPEDEVIYFVLPDRFENGDAANDRGGIEGGRLQHGFDPTHKGYYHGGDLRGLAQRLDYIQGLGATAIWLTPVFRNKTVQGPPGQESAAYHGYWITDFTRVDPHLGDEQDFAALVAAAHARGMKVYMDIVVNHTADVIRYRECPRNDCVYRSKADYPYTRRGGLAGGAINEGFLGDDPAHRDEANFARLRRPDWAYTPYVPAGEEHAKVPEWLNDPIYYHNRGDSTFEGESSTYGDFFGLDDLMTEHPRVVRGFIDIYGDWIERYGIDGFRIDTAKHVDPQFWQAFVPAMLERARRRGIPNFAIFGEVAFGGIDPAYLALHTRVDRLPSVLDFDFANAMHAAIAGQAGTRTLSDMFADDPVFEGGEAGARRLTTFISNHDDGRLGRFLLDARPQIGDEEALARIELAYAMLLTLRGVPAIYYGDEQGFAGRGNDQDARQDMFPTQVAQYREERRFGAGATPGDAGHFDAAHPLYRAIARLTRLRAAQPALRRGAQVTRADAKVAGLFAVSRFDPDTGREIVLAFNTGASAVAAQVEVGSQVRGFEALAGPCAAQVSAPGSYRVELAPLQYAVCAAR